MWSFEYSPTRPTSVIQVKRPPAITRPTNPDLYNVPILTFGA